MYRYDIFFFFNDTATTEIYTLSLHDALPICDFAAAIAELDKAIAQRKDFAEAYHARGGFKMMTGEDRKSTRLNSSHANISYAVFCLKKKKTKSYYLTANFTYYLPHNNV